MSSSSSRWRRWWRPRAFRAFSLASSRSKAFSRGDLKPGGGSYNSRMTGPGNVSHWSLILILRLLFILIWAKLPHHDEIKSDGVTKIKPTLLFCPLSFVNTGTSGQQNCRKARRDSQPSNLLWIYTGQSGGLLNTFISYLKAQPFSHAVWDIYVKIPFMLHALSLLSNSQFVSRFMGPLGKLQVFCSNVDAGPCPSHNQLRFCIVFSG